MTAKKAVRKRTPLLKKGVTFKSRGPNKCIQVNGKNQTGLHSALRRTFFPSWSYETCKANGTLITKPPCLPASEHIPAVGLEAKPIGRYPPSSAKKAGNKLDTQVHEAHCGCGASCSP